MDGQCQRADRNRRQRGSQTMLTIVLAAILVACGQRSGVGDGSAPRSGDPAPTSIATAPSTSAPDTAVVTHPPSTPSARPTDPGQLAVLPSELDGGLSAPVQGRLVFRGTCVYLNVLYRAPLHRIVWPTGTSWQEEPFPAVILRNGEILRDGDPLNAGGGFVPDAELGLNIGDDLAARSFECDEAVGTEMLNNDLTTWIEGPSVLPAHQGCSRSASRGVAVRGIRRLRLRCWT